MVVYWVTNWIHMLSKSSRFPGIQVSCILTTYGFFTLLVHIRYGQSISIKAEEQSTTDAFEVHLSRNSKSLQKELQPFCSIINTIHKEATAGTMFQQKGALIFVAVLALSFSIQFISACEDYRDSLCIYVDSTRGGTNGYGWFCSSELTTYMVYMMCLYE